MANMGLTNLVLERHRLGGDASKTRRVIAIVNHMAQACAYGQGTAPACGRTKRGQCALSQQGHSALGITLTGSADVSPWIGGGSPAHLD